MPSDVRPYEQLAGELSDEISTGGSAEQRMQAVVEVLWRGLQKSGVSWVGFYVDRPRKADDERLSLGPCRDHPACTPIGLHGVCGQALRFGRPRVVPDVRELGPDYIACDERDRSEIVIPLLDDKERCWAVLDLDSHDKASFDDDDARGLCRVLRAAGFATPDA
jgi:putative methionine-R-sulfoxide reductase with GAF domain